VGIFSTRRRFLKHASFSGVAAFLASCLSSNAPAASGAPTTAASGGTSAAPTVIARADAITWKVQSGWAGNDIFQELFIDWKNMVEEMSGGRLKIDALPVNAVTNINGAIDAVHAGTLDGAHHVPAYYYGKDHAVSLMGTGPTMGMSGQMWLAWYYFGGGQALFEKLVQQKLKLNVVSLYHMPMQNQPLGWFKDEIKGPDDFKGMKFRTVGLATGIYQFMGASVISVAGAEVASALDRGTIDAAEFNNTTSDSVYGLPDVRKVCMTQSYHQASEILVIDLNKSKYDAMPKDLQAIMKYAAYAESAQGEWKFYDKNSTDYQKLVAKGVRFIPQPRSVSEAQMAAWKKIVADESANNPDFAAIIESQRKWAQRIFPWANTMNIRFTDQLSYDALAK
jgi:TRAP-type mannitol/chloroaromatic compound transport system substrate-binding protein